jgi:transcriptional regulator GlxA family with amidase domain
MRGSNKPISRAVEELKAHISEVARVYEWAEHMGYDNPKKFSRHFLRYFGVRPQKAITYIRLRSIVKQLRYNDQQDNYEIAQSHGIPDEKALNNFTNFHIGMSPSEIKTSSNKEINRALENLGSKFK